MKNGVKILDVTECDHLSKILSTISDFPIVDHAINAL